MTSAEQDYYEDDSHWVHDYLLDAEERARFEASMEMIPSGARSVLDVGCGNGTFVNAIQERYKRVCGVDRSLAALRYVKGEKYQASVDALPFVDGEFDVVTCMEVIEHLPQGIYEKAISELCRVSKQWLIISVPHKEDRVAGLVRCPHCHCQFNRSYHLRSFNETSMHDLFRSSSSDVSVEVLKRVGIVNIPIGLSLIRRIRGLGLGRDLPKGTICPQCSYGRSEIAGGGALRGGGRRGIRELFPVRRRPRWWLGLYEKQSAGWSSGGVTGDGSPLRV